MPEKAGIARNRRLVDHGDDARAEPRRQLYAVLVRRQQRADVGEGAAPRRAATSAVQRAAAAAGREPAGDADAAGAEQQIAQKVAARKTELLGTGKKRIHDSPRKAL
jgi:hypothetical protein